MSRKHFFSHTIPHGELLFLRFPSCGLCDPQFGPGLAWAQNSGPKRTVIPDTEPRTAGLYCDAELTTHFAGMSFHASVG